MHIGWRDLGIDLCRSRDQWQLPYTWALYIDCDRVWHVWGVSWGKSIRFTLKFNKLEPSGSAADVDMYLVTTLPRTVNYTKMKIRTLLTGFRVPSCHCQTSPNLPGPIYHKLGMDLLPLASHLGSKRFHCNTGPSHETPNARAPAVVS